MKAIFYVLPILLLAGCVAENDSKTIYRHIRDEEQELKSLSVKIDSLDRQRISKASAGSIDETTDSVTKVYIQRLKDSVNTRLEYFNAIVHRPKNKSTKADALKYLASVKQQYDKDLNNVIFLDDLFKASTFNRLNTAAFFGPGEYELDDSSAANASVIMKNIIKEAHDFSAKHADRKLKALFIVLGYADEQEISKGTDLYNKLAPITGSKKPDRQHLNTELSNRRASSIKNILKNQYKLVFPANEGYLFSSSFIATGKGEQLPTGDIKNYQSYDERRRVVLLYWSILPDLN